MELGTLMPKKEPPMLNGVRIYGWEKPGLLRRLREEQEAKKPKAVGPASLPFRGVGDTDMVQRDGGEVRSLTPHYQALLNAYFGVVEKHKAAWIMDVSPRNIGAPK